MAEAAGMTSSGTSRGDPGGRAIRPDAGEELHPGELVDGYVIQEEIGRGGMGVVYLAKETRTGRLCALKQIRGDLAHRLDALERFLTEGTILAQLEHPCIVTLYGTGMHRGRPYFVMQWVQGRPLRELMQIRRAPFTLSQTLSMAIQIGSALAAAHELRIVHRDLKPENVVILRRGRGALKVLDFGIAKLGDGAPTTDRLTVLVTPLYAAPEQLLRKPVDGRTDVYALALLIVELATGRHALADVGETMPADAMVADLQRKAQPNRLIEHVRNCPPSLSAVVERALAKDRELRPHMAPFVAALRAERTQLDAGGAAKEREEEEYADVEKEEGGDARPPASRGTAPLVPSFRPVDRTQRMASASALLAAQGKTLEQAQAEARTHTVRGTERMLQSASALLAAQGKTLEQAQAEARTHTVKGTERMVQSASAQLAAQGKTLEQAQAEARSRPASLPPAPVSGTRPRAPLAVTTPLRIAPRHAAPEIPRPSIEMMIPRPSLQLTPAAPRGMPVATWARAPLAAPPRQERPSHGSVVVVIATALALALLLAVAAVRLVLWATARGVGSAPAASIAASAAAPPSKTRRLNDVE